jgi:non-heme Fe2+,alpha-ketoglutarate-dependent halogenase
MPTSEPLPVQDIRFFPASEHASPRRLSAQQIRQFNQSGYLVGLRMFDEAGIKHNRREFDRLLAQAIALGMDTYSLTNYERICSSFYDLIVHPPLLDAVQDILGPDIVCWGTHCFTKLPGDQKQVAWHQDAPYWKLTPSRTVTAWLAIDDISVDNGAMRVLPGSHLQGALPLRQSAAEENNALWLTCDGAATFGDPVSLVQGAGHISLHADLLLHDSPANHSSRRRCGMAMRYCTPEVRLIDGSNRDAVLCRGVDASGFWTPVRRPTTNDISTTKVPVNSVARPVSDFAKTLTAS